MKNKSFAICLGISIIVTLLLSAYPLYMGIRVVSSMITDGAVAASEYPKYIIPYTPISISVIFALLVMPLVMKYFAKYATLAASLASTALFFVTELLFESLVIVTDTAATKLESWQMYMCYVPPEMYETRTWKPIDVLIGEYSPTFKIHFYVIAIILIIAFIGCFYGFADAAANRRKDRIKPLIIQSLITLMFLGLCIFACFTAFFRSGELTVSPLSASLMAVFFILMGVTAGIFAAVQLSGKSRFVSLIVPSALASLVALVMYIAEMCLLHGNLYRFGNGFLFDGLGALVLAPVDIAVIIASGTVTAVICRVINGGRK